MLSVVPILALTLALQTDVPAPGAAPAPATIDAAIATAEPAPAPAPEAADDPIGALMQQQELAVPAAAPPPVAPAAAPIAAVPVPVAPVATAPVTPPPPAAAAPSTANVAAIPAPAPAPVQSYVRPTPAPSQAMDEDEDAAEAHAGLPSAPRPYASLPATPSVRPNAALFNNPMVRLPPAPAGSLDGGWVLTRSDGRKLYSFQFNDTGGGNEIEGAWRDLDREWSILGSGPVTSVGYEGSGVTIRFFERGRTDMSVVLLTRAASGDWTGEFQSKNGPTQVIMRRN